jgi:pilus assembly protein CpaB
MRVDVLITGIPPGTSAAGGPSVRTLLQNLEVLSAGADIEKDKEGKPRQVQVVNLLVDPHQAEILSLAGNETRIQLVLRNPMDTKLTSPPGTSISDLFTTPGAPARKTPERRVLPVVAQIAPPPPDTSPRIADTERIEVLNGPARTVASFGGQEAHQ